MKDQYKIDMKKLRTGGQTIWNVMTGVLSTTAIIFSISSSQSAKGAEAFLRTIFFGYPQSYLWMGICISACSYVLAAAIHIIAQKHWKKLRGYALMVWCASEFIFALYMLYRFWNRSTFMFPVYVLVHGIVFAAGCGLIGNKWVRAFTYNLWFAFRDSRVGLRLLAYGALGFVLIVLAVCFGFVGNLLC